MVSIDKVLSRTSEQASTQITLERISARTDHTLFTLYARAGSGGWPQVEEQARAQFEVFGEIMSVKGKSNIEHRTSNIEHRTCIEHMHVCLCAFAYAHYLPACVYNCRATK
jgi:hypothetical protein